MGCVICYCILLFKWIIIFIIIVGIIYMYSTRLLWSDFNCFSFLALSVCVWARLYIICFYENNRECDKKHTHSYTKCFVSGILLNNCHFFFFTHYTYPHTQLTWYKCRVSPAQRIPDSSRTPSPFSVMGVRRWNLFKYLVSYYL